jgi:signal transduction histidine kinase
VLENLIGNALKHTPAGGEVRVGARVEDHHLMVEVRDSGAGITAADLPHVFDRHYRGDGAKSAAERGAGLGLAIARRIVELHGGHIGAENAAPRGARLWFTLPLAGGAGREGGAP